MTRLPLVFACLLFVAGAAACLGGVFLVTARDDTSAFLAGILGFCGLTGARRLRVREGVLS